METATGPSRRSRRLQKLEPLEDAPATSSDDPGSTTQVTQCRAMVSPVSDSDANPQAVMTATGNEVTNITFHGVHSEQTHLEGASQAHAPSVVPNASSVMAGSSTASDKQNHSVLNNCYFHGEEESDYPAGPPRIVFVEESGQPHPAIVPDFETSQILQAAAQAERARREEGHRGPQQLQAISEFRDWCLKRRDHVRDLQDEHQHMPGTERMVQRLNTEAHTLTQMNSIAWRDEELINTRAVEVEAKAQQAQQMAAITLENLFVEHTLIAPPSRIFRRTEWDAHFEQTYAMEQYLNSDILPPEENEHTEPTLEPPSQTASQPLSPPTVRSQAEHDQEVPAVSLNPGTPELDPEVVATVEARRTLRQAKYTLGRAQAEFDNRLSVQDAQLMAFRSMYVQNVGLEESYEDFSAREHDRERKLTRTLIEAEEAFHDAKHRARGLGIDTMTEVSYVPYDVAALSAVAGEDPDQARIIDAPKVLDWMVMPEEGDVVASKAAAEHEEVELAPYRADDADFDRVDQPAGPWDSASQVAEMGDYMWLIKQWSSYSEALRNAGPENSEFVPLPSGI